jgi:hypothetical protein
MMFKGMLPPFMILVGRGCHAKWNNGKRLYVNGLRE